MDSLTAMSDTTDNNCVSSICCEALSSDLAPPDVAALRKLSENLESLFKSPGFDFYSDAKIVVGGSGGREIAVHRCVLTTRSPFFRSVFASLEKETGEKKLELKEMVRGFDVGYEAVVTVLAYLYSGRLTHPPLPKGVCVCADDDCSHIGCRPAVDFLVEVLYASFTFQIAELVTLYQRHLLHILAKVAINDILVILSVANMCDKVCGSLLTKCIEIVVKSDIDIVTLEKELPQEVVKQIMDTRSSLGLGGQESKFFPDKHVRRIHKALDSDDIALVRMLLNEAPTSLDDAFALHYAVAYCDSKTVKDLLELELADVNLRNLRGYTVLHIAAIRKEPNIIVSLLTKGARPFDLTLDGRKALQISKRVTKAVDYDWTTEEGKASPKDRLCIEILEREERRDPLLGEVSESLEIAGDEAHMQLLYLENRVSLAKLLFPSEAQVAMDNAHVDSTSEFQLSVNSKHSSGNQRTTVHLNELPLKIMEENLARMRALSRTVALGRRFFPHCSAELNKIMDDEDLNELALLGNAATPEDRERKRQRYMEIQDILTKAFDEDKELDRYAISKPASSSTSMEVRSKFVKRRDTAVRL